MRFSIGIIVLNWNRSDLLDRCIGSLIETTTDYDQCIIIDNNSQDGSVETIKKWASVDRRIKPFLMEENRGAEWINDALKLIESDLVFILANDKELMTGWREYVDAAFSAFPKLGQLALHAPAPLDDEVWVTKSANYAYRDGVSLYVANTNTGMSSVVRTEILKGGSIYFGNIDGGNDVKLPNDLKFSAEIHAAGYFSAWSERYYSKNVGHTLAEFERDWAYYKENYQSKDWLKLEGLQRRIEEHKSRPRPYRSSRIFGWSAYPESYGGAEDASVRCWSTFGDGSVDLETLDFIYALCRLVKPRNVGVLRAGAGNVAVAIGRALQDNGFGQVTCYETDVFLSARLRSNILQYSVSEFVTCASGDLNESYDLLVLAGYVEAEFSSRDHEFVLGIVARSNMVLVDASQSASSLFSEISKSDGWSRMKFPTPRAIQLMTRDADAVGLGEVTPRHLHSTF